MEITRSYTDRNHQLPIAATAVMTDTHHHEVRCGMCARELYVDEEAHKLYTEALIAGLDNPFRCEVCSEEYDDRVFAG